MFRHLAIRFVVPRKAKRVVCGCTIICSSNGRQFSAVAPLSNAFRRRQLMLNRSAPSVQPLDDNNKGGGRGGDGVSGSGSASGSGSGSAAATGGPNNKPNVLKRFLIDRIKLNGPMSVAEYMQICVGSPGAGYYSKQDDGEIFGGRGDFVTSPEFTQMMGELVGVWVVNEFFRMSHSGPWQLIELGPGSGNLMHDVLGVLRKFRLTDQDQLLQVRLLETSRQLICEQATVLCGDDDTFATSIINLGKETNAERQKVNNAETASSSTNDAYLNTTGLLTELCSKKSLFGPQVFWHDSLHQMPQKFSVFLAHEFFDALPIHKFKRTEQGWREVLIGLDATGSNLIYVKANGLTVAHKLYLTPELMQQVEGEDLEISPASAQVCLSLAERVNSTGGAALIVDYGTFGKEEKLAAGGDTLRAFYHHKQVDPLSQPGRCDVTCDVDFDYLTSILGDRVCLVGPIEQSTFLRHMGLEVRLEKLLQAAQSDQERNYLKESYRLLTDPQQMGRRFKVMALFPKSMEKIIRDAPPSGFCPLNK